MSMNQNASAFARVGAKIVDQGFSAVPVMPGAKIPGELRRGEWRRMCDWQRFGERRPTEIELEIWGKWEDGGVCVALGGPLNASEQLVAVDVDSTDERVVEAIRGILEPSLVEKTGLKGYTGFYRASQAVATRTFDVDGSRAVDLLARGRQTVVPPSLHPQTGREYVWTTPLTLTDVTLDKLPLLPDDIVERLSAALAPFGTVAVSEPVRRYRDDDYCGPWTEANNAALDNLDAWLPHLNVAAKRERDGSYRGPALWRGGDNPTSVSYDHRGIRDFKANEGLTPIDIVQKAGVANGDWDSDDWLREKLGLPVLKRVKFRFRSEAAAEAPAAEAKPARRDPLDAITLGRDVDWRRPHGILGEIADWILETAQSPNRPLAVAAADATLAVVAGRANLYGPTFSALSVYTVMLGKTTIGKDRALKAVEQILRAAHLSPLCAGDGYSLSAMEAILGESPAVIMTVDEIAKNLFGGKANSHESAILGFLLKLFTRNMGDPPYTSTRRSPKSIVQHVTVDSPQFSLLGASTPEGFYEALQAGNLDDGFMNRLIVVEAAPRTSNNAVRAAHAPKSICDALQGIVLAGRGSNPLARTLRPVERMVPWASDAVEIEWRRLRDQVHTIIDSVPTREGSLYGRIAEQTARFAARHALSRDGVAAAVDMVDLEWGAAFVRQSVRTMRDGAATMMASSEFERNVNTILALVQKRGTIMLSDLAREIRIEPYRRDAALGHLQTAHQIEMSSATSGPGGGRPSRLIRYIRG